MTTSKTIRRKYRKGAGTPISAIQLKLDTEGLKYTKWGAEQSCKPGDWIVDNEEDVYTIDQAEFSRTYTKISEGRYVKTANIWARKANESGAVKTLEGTTAYEKGDYLIANSEHGEDSYAISSKKFEEMYELAGS